MALTEVSSKTVADGIEAFRFYKRMEWRMRRTLRDYDRVLADVAATVGDVCLQDLKLSTVRAYVHGLVERGWRSAMVNVYVRIGQWCSPS